MSQEQMNLNITLDKTTGMSCDECSNEIFQEGVMLRKASRFITGTAQIMGLAETLKASDEKIKFLETELQGLFKKYLDLKSELDHYIMLTNTANKNQNDSRYY